MWAWLWVWCGRFSTASASAPLGSLPGRASDKKTKCSAIRQAQEQSATEFRTPGVQIDRYSASQASGTPEKANIRNQQHSPQVYPPYTPSQRYPKYAITALATTAPEYMGCYGPAEPEHHVAFPWRVICRRSHMGAQLNPTSIALVATLDYPSATKMDVAEDRARTAVLPSVAYHGGGGSGHKTHSRLNSTPSKVGVGGPCSSARCILPQGSHSTFGRAPGH